MLKRNHFANGSTILSLNSKNSFNFDHTLILSSNEMVMLDYFSSLMLKIHLARGFDLILAVCTYLVIGTMWFAILAFGHFPGKSIIFHVFATPLPRLQKAIYSSGLGTEWSNSSTLTERDIRNGDFYEVNLRFITLMLNWVIIKVIIRSILWP